MQLNRQTDEAVEDEGYETYNKCEKDNQTAKDKKQEI
jgi:hypothetical protein